MTEELLIVKIGEIILKGLNRKFFEQKLISNIKKALSEFGKVQIRYMQSTIYIEPMGEDVSLDEVMAKLKKVFGIVNISRVAKTEKDLNLIIGIAKSYLRESLLQAKTFKVESKRSDKHFYKNSQQISADVGEALLEEFSHLKVDVHQPEIVVRVEVRDKGAYVYIGKHPGAGGMPVGTGGRATLLLSGGIDSPVAGYMIAKRGVELSMIHFESPPYTSDRAKEKVIELARLVGEYAGKIRLFMVPFTEIQMAIYEKCPQEYLTLIMRRLMMKIAEEVALKEGASALITGESLGQVASQTIQAIDVTNRAVKIPVFRPLIGMDKEEIIQIARKIGTFETSILPYEDCCTVFVPKHPKTKPQVAFVEKAESVLEIEDMVVKAIEKTELIYL